MHNTRGPGAEDDVENRHPEEQDAREKCAKRNTKLKHYRLHSVREKTSAPQPRYAPTVGLLDGMRASIRWGLERGYAWGGTMDGDRPHAPRHRPAEHRGCSDHPSVP